MGVTFRLTSMCPPKECVTGKNCMLYKGLSLLVHFQRYHCQPLAIIDYNSDKDIHLCLICEKLEIAKGTLSRNLKCPAQSGLLA